MEGRKTTQKQALLSGVPDEEALSLIARYTRNKPDAGDLYTFTVTLCDNEIDRDNERFSIEALYALKEMFVGVTGIFDHSMKSADQTARIYKTEVVEDAGKRTQAGEIYTSLKAWCYMLRTPKNEELIREIDGGIKKEVSISCAVGEKLCSLCGQDMRSSECCHSCGKTAAGKKCHAILSSPTDAYEWSFVAVPAQKKAGVSKSMKNRNKTDKQPDRLQETEPASLLKSVLAAKGNVILTEAQTQKMAGYLAELQNDAANGRRERLLAERDVIALSAFTLPNADTVMLADILKKLNTQEVFMLRKAFSDRADRLSADTPVFGTAEAKDFREYSQFKI